MKIFVTGGTGTVGDILVGNLLGANHEVTVITRNISRVKNSWKDQVNLIEGDVMQSGVWQGEMVKHDIVVHLVGENVFGKRWSEKQKNAIYNSRVLSSRLIADAIKSSEHPPKAVISVSGTDYYPHSGEKVFKEDNEPGDHFLAKVAIDWEQPFKDLGNDIRVVIFRMGVAFSYDGSGAERMFIPHKLFVGGWIGSGEQIYSWIHIKDFAGLLYWAIENGQINGIFNGVAPSYHSMKELANIGGKIMGRWTWTWLPGIVLKIILGARSQLLLQGRAVSSDKVVEAGYNFKFPTAEDAFEDILPQLTIF